MGMLSATPPLIQLDGFARSHRLLAPLTGFALIVAIVTMVAPGVGAVLGPVMLPIMSLATGITGLRKAGKFENRRDRVAWTLISVAFLSAAAGLLTFVAFTPFVEVGAFGPGDIPITFGYVLLTAGLLAMPTAVHDRAERTRVFLDASVGAVSVVAVSWVWFIQSVWNHLAGAPAWDRVFGSAYPVLDMLMIIVAMIMFLRRSERRFDLRLGLVAAGLAFQVAADLIFVISGAGRSFADAQPDFGFFLVAFVFYAITVMSMDKQPRAREYAQRMRPPFWPLLVPYAAAIVMVGALFVAISNAETTQTAWELLAATLLVGILVSLRQVVAIHENRHHVERERKALISTISHELRTPLTAMVGFLDLINGNEVELSEEERGEMMEVVDQQARYLWRIVADLVLLARGKSDQIELEISRVDLREIVDRAATAVDTGMNDVRILVSAGLVATVDADRVQQALVNLLSNAVRYGGGQRALIATADRDDLVLEVHDDGPGVPKRYELAIWERFERGANRLNATVPGSGVGLAIVDAIARAHGGVTGYRRSEILGGACFSLRLPDAVVPVSAPASAGELPLAGSGLEEVGDTAQNRSLIR